MYAALLIVAALRKYSIIIEETVLLYTCAVMCGLSTELAVFRAFAAPAVDYAAKVCVISVKILYHWQKEMSTYFVLTG